MNRYFMAVVLNVFLPVLLLGSSAFADSFFVSEVVGTGIDQDLRVSVRELARTAVSESGGTLAGDPNEADYLLRPQLIRLGTAYVLTIARIKEGKRVGSAKEKASNVEELDRITLRAVRAAMKDISPKEDIRVGEVTQKEQKELKRRRESLNLKYFAFGPAAVDKLNNTSSGIHLVYGYISEVNFRAAVRFAVEGTLITTGPAASVLAATLGASYYLNDADISPYVFGDFGYAAGVAKDMDTATGFSLGGGLGLIFFRTSSTQMDLSVRYLAIMDDPNPSTIGIRLGILY